MASLSGLLDFGWEPNAPRWSGPPVESRDGYDLAIVEFDDQGWYHVPAARDALVAYLNAAIGRDLVIIVFVHGWRHNADPKDKNLHSVRSLLRDAAANERQRERPRQVLGVYLAWRGLSLRGVASYATFWTRKNAAFRIAVGSVREVLARLRRHQRDRNASLGEEEMQAGAGTRLVLAGHSFGGLILFSAVSEYLVESLARQKVVRPFGDLIILVNPAFEATRYQPILTAALAHGDYPSGQRVCFLAVTATNDRATRVAFPVGRWLSTRFEAVKHEYPGLPRNAQRDANLNTVGHLGWLKTHRLTAPGARRGREHDAYEGSGPADLERENADFAAFNAQWRPDGSLLPNWRRSYTAGAVLEHVAGDPANPFWVVEAAPEVVYGHNGIFGPVFLDFLRQLCDDRLRRSAAA